MVNRRNFNPGGRAQIAQALLAPASIIGGLVIWALAARVSGLPAFILPPPALVWETLVNRAADGSLLFHFVITLAEVLGGLALGLTVASVLGYLLAKSSAAEKLLSPYIVASQAVPIVAVAPLLIIWFGPGITSKILICALIVFFPVLVNITVGIRSVPENLHALMRSLNATQVQTFWKLEVPAALPVLLGGLRIGATLSVIGAVVGEYIGSDRGLGFLVRLGDGSYNTALVFVAVLALVVMALGLYGIVVALERRFLRW